MLQQLEEYGIRDSALAETPEISFSEQVSRGEEVYDRYESMKLLMWLFQYGSGIDEEWMYYVSLGHKTISFGRDIICEGEKEHKNVDDLSLTFNYSETLEKLYHVAGSQICHIHGSRTARNEKLIIGHGNDSECGFDKIYRHFRYFGSGNLRSSKKYIQDHQEPC